MIAENGALLAEKRFATGLTISEIDVQRLVYERRRLTTFPAEPSFRDPSCGCLAAAWAEFTPCQTPITRYVSPTPFVPENAADRADRVRGDFDHRRHGSQKAAGAHRRQNGSGGPERRP